MKKIVLALFVFMALQSSAIVWEVEASGGPGIGTPLYTPQNLSINLNDEIHWTWVSGMHNCTTTSGPVSFASGTHSAPFDWSFTFSTAGVYEYECTVGNHAATQFGVITVSSTIGVNEIKANVAPDFTIMPNPASDNLIIEKKSGFEADMTIYDITGKVVLSEQGVADIRRSFNISSLTRGIYFVELNNNGRIIRKKLLVSRN
jgi:plastocyanin